MTVAKLLLFALCASARRLPGLKRSRVKKPVRTKGDTWSASMLVAGTSIGAGILALPSATYASGVVPSSMTLVLGWMFTSVAGLLIAEATQQVKLRTGRKGLGFVATLGEILGRGPEVVAMFLFGFVVYSMMVAYVAQGGVLLSFAPAPQMLFACTLGALLTFGSPKAIDAFNNVFVAVVVASFVVIVSLGIPQVVPSRFKRADWTAAPRALPICALALVYHTVVPYIVDKLDADKRSVSVALLGGSALPLVMFLVWNAVVLGAVPSGAGIVDPVAILRAGGDGASLLGFAVSLFSMMAIVTSVIGLFFGMRSYIADLCRLPPVADLTLSHHLALAAGVLGPPVYFATSYPDAFMAALDLAGSFGVTTLFGAMPVVAVWRLRQNPLPASTRRTVPPSDELLITPGGTPLLAAQLALTIFMIADALKARLA